ncbi:rhino [Drosophila simulans]|uniref:Rhino n=1 Tax=Drosophila simulans TaxID=7240 RepID=B4QBB0_DROSI|nr:rhino [Drosophila simulans]
MSRKNQRPNLGLVDAPPNDHVQEFVVEKIQGKRFVNGRPQVLVKWHGFPDESNTWEPMENVGNCMQLVSDFESELFRRMRNASAKPVGKSKPSPSSSSPSNTENGPSSSKKTQHSKSVQAKNTAKMSKTDQKKEKDIKKTAGKIKDIQNDPKTQMPSTSQGSTGLTEAFNGNPSATTNVIKSPRIHSVFNDPNLSESSEDEAVGATSLNYQRAGHSKQKSSTPPKSRGLIEFPQGEDEDSLLSSKNVSPMMILKESQPLQNSFTDDSDLGESSSSKSFLTVSSTSSEGSIKVTKSEPKTSSLDQIKLSTRSSDDTSSYYFPSQNRFVPSSGSFPRPQPPSLSGFRASSGGFSPSPGSYQEQLLFIANENAKQSPAVASSQFGGSPFGGSSQFAKPNRQTDYYDISPRPFGVPSGAGPAATAGLGAAASTGATSASVTNGFTRSTAIRNGSGNSLGGGFQPQTQRINVPHPQTQFFAHFSEFGLNEVYSGAPQLNKWYKKVRIDSFSKGSVLVDYYVELANITEDVDTLEIRQLFHDALTKPATPVLPDKDAQENETDSVSGPQEEQLVTASYQMGKYIIDPVATDFSVIAKNAHTNVEFAEEDLLIPQWAIVVIVIGVGSLVFVVIFGVTVLLNRQKRAKKTPIPLTNDMLNELKVNHMGGADNYGVDDFYNIYDPWNDTQQPIKPQGSPFPTQCHGSTVPNIHDSGRSTGIPTTGGNYFYDHHPPISKKETSLKRPQLHHGTHRQSQRQHQQAYGHQYPDAFADAHQMYSYNNHASRTRYSRDYDPDF